MIGRHFNILAEESEQLWNFLPIDQTTDTNLFDLIDRDEDMCTLVLVDWLQGVEFNFLPPNVLFDDPCDSADTKAGINNFATVSEYDLNSPLGQKM